MIRKNLSILLLLALSTVHLQAQSVKDFFYVDTNNNDLPVFVRGNMAGKKMILYLSGGYGENAIDFARSDYAGWKNSLEKDYAIAYYDKYGLNKRLNKIDTMRINRAAYTKDIHRIIKALKARYNVAIYLMGMSAGGMLAYDYLIEFNKVDESLIEAAIVMATPFTSDSSPKRYTHYRPSYLKNLSKEFIELRVDTSLWKEAYNWMDKTDSIYSIETSRQWNQYVDMAHPTKKRRIAPWTALGVLFSKPYNPIRYLYSKDNDLVADNIWQERQKYTDQEFARDLKKINHQMLIMTGRYDAIAVPEEMKLFDQYIPNAKVVIIPDAHHQLYLYQPELVNKTIKRFMEKN